MANDIHRRVLDSDTGVELLVLDGSPVTVGLTAPKASMALDRTNSEAWLSQGAGAWTKFGLGSVSWASITGKPTDVAGFGITDVYTKTQSDSRYVDVTGDTMSGALSVLTSLSGANSIAVLLYPGGAYGFGMGPTSTQGYVNYYSGTSSTDSYGHRFYVNSVEQFRISGAGLVAVPASYLTVGAYAGVAKSVGDIVARRSSTSGVIYFGEASTTYLYWDGTSYFFGGTGGVVVGGMLTVPPSVGIKFSGVDAGLFQTAGIIYIGDYASPVNGLRINHTTGLLTVTGGLVVGSYAFSVGGTVDDFYAMNSAAYNTTRDVFGGNYPAVMNQHTGWSFTSHDNYGGFRIWAQGYPVLWTGASLVARFMAAAITLNSPTTVNNNLSATGFVRSGSYFYADQNYGYGLVGLYDQTKYRAVYMMGGSFLPPADGSALTGMYGIFFAYDHVSAGKNVTGLSYSHGFGNVANGTVYNFFGAAGTWIGTPLYVSGTGRFTGAVTMDAALSVGTTLTVTSTIVGQAHVWAYGGVLYLASSGTKYLYWDGTTFNLVGGYLTAGSGLYVPSYFDTTARQLIGTWTVISGSFIIPAAGIFYLDGGGDTYLYEVSANAIRLVAGGALGLQVTSSYILIQPTSKFYLDGGGDTYAYESSANVIDFYAGGSQSVRMAAASGTLYGAWAITGALTLSSSLSGAAITATGDITATADVKVTGAVTQKKGTSTYYDTQTVTVSTSNPPGSSSGFPTGHCWTKVTAPI